MLIKRLSKIGITLLLAVSFIVPSYFPARAEFTNTDSTNLRNAAEDTANIYTRLGTSNTHLNNINTKLTNIYNDVGSIKNAVTNSIATTINTISTTLTSIKGYVDQIEGYVDGVENKLDTISGALATSNGNWVTLGNYIDAIYNTESTNGTVLTDTYNLLNSSLIPAITSIDNTNLIIKDNISVMRNSDTPRSISLGSTSYDLVKTPVYTFSIQDQQIVASSTYHYVNFFGMLHYRFVELRNIANVGFQLTNAFLNVIQLDTQYLGEELHLHYQNMDAFKIANHTDIINFKNANHADITAFNIDFNTFANNWLSWTDQFVILKDHLSVIRVYDDNSHVITLTGIAGRSVTYDTTSMVVPLHTFNNTTKKFETTNSQRWTNFAGMISFRLRALGDSFTAYFSYLNDQSPADSIRNNVAVLDQNLTQLEQAESQVTNSAIQRINNFIPDPNSIGALSALSWGSNFLQRIFVALGAFNIPIICALVLSVCMQFIGYFKYKT